MSETETAPHPVPQSPVKRTVFWDPQARAFHVEGLSAPPAHAIQLPDDFDHLELLSKESSDHAVVHDDATGLPTIAPRVKAAPTFDQAVKNLKQELLAHEMAGVSFTPSGAAAAITFGTDSASLGRYAAAAFSAQSGTRKDGAPLIAADGLPVALSNADALALVTKVHAYLAQCSDAYANLYAAVTTDPSAPLDAGWPANT